MVPVGSCQGVPRAARHPAIRNGHLAGRVKCRNRLEYIDVTMQHHALPAIPPLVWQGAFRRVD
jgi:hypothetical protein